MDGVRLNSIGFVSGTQHEIARVVVAPLALFCALVKIGMPLDHDTATYGLASDFVGSELVVYEGTRTCQVQLLFSTNKIKVPQTSIYKSYLQ